MGDDTDVVPPVAAEYKFQYAPTGLFKDHANSHLCDDLDTICDERDAAREALDTVIAELLIAQSELEDEKKRTADKDTEIAKLREEIRQMSLSDSEEAAVLEGLEKRPENARESDASRIQTLEEENTALQQETHDLIARLETKNAESQDKTQELYDQASKLQDLEDELHQQKEKARQEQKRQEVLLGSQTDVAELERLLAFYKSNGEKVSRRARNIRAAQRKLETLLQAQDAQLQEQASLLVEFKAS